MTRRVSLLPVTLVCLLFLSVVAYTYQLKPIDNQLTAHQLDAAQYLLSQLMTVGKVDARCHFNKTILSESCSINVDQHVDIGFVHQHIKFNATLGAQFNPKAFTLTIRVNVDNRWRYEHKFSLDDLAQICFPFFEVLKLCVDFSNIEISLNKDCFAADMHVDVRVLTLRLELLKEHIGYHEDQCRAIKHM